MLTESMNQDEPRWASWPAPTVKKKKGLKLTGSVMVLIAFATAFFPRTAEWLLRFPTPINFLHFITIPFVCFFILFNSRTQDRQQLAIARRILVLLVLLAIVELTSAYINQAGIVNAFLSYMLLAEPFLLLLAIISLPLSSTSFKRIQTWFIGFCCFHTFLAYVQKYVLRMDVARTKGLTGGDNIQGVFYESGAGHVVGASVALTFGLYFLFSMKQYPLWVRLGVVLLCFWHMIMADGKQVLLSLMVAWVILFLTKLKNLGEVVKYVGGGGVFGYGFFWCIQNVPAFRAFNVWIRPHLYGPDGEATLLKTAAFRIIPTFYESFLNVLFGLGPGHTVSRLGGWMLRDYDDLLLPLGATTHQATRDVWAAVGKSWLGDQSSLFSPLFGWAGIWGDLGMVGLLAYLALGAVVWHCLRWDDFSKFLLLTVGVVGCIFSQMEEPGYMLSIAVILGLRWQEHRVQRIEARQALMQDYQLAYEAAWINEVDEADRSNYSAH